ncbi:hypothetical protein HIO71_12115 [Chryseobacterium aquaticum]|uniref:Uncharacterized protein n=1 Tax=Chryseobacterium aquaticum TaxID=452084 RepID=A0A848N8Z3_9FLAO|nr:MULTISPECIES: hypothetical protein [Chryseobacterium]NMR34931.1 hypothetical protein [Chryseobacterium aquaticum]NRQ47205.1 hypothetical protein [Chryseobacterium sp. C-204]
MKKSILEFYSTLDKARDRALWLEFEHRDIPKHFVVFDGPENNFAVADLQTTEEMEITHHYYSLPENYQHWTYGDLKGIAGDPEMLSHFEELLGKFSVMEGDLLKFILKYQVPLDKIIRYELGCRGFDADNRWIGFTESEKVWQQ